MKDDQLIQAMAEAMKPIFAEAIQLVLEANKLEVPERDVMLLEEACKETGLVAQTIYMYTSTKWQKRNPDRVPIPHHKRGNKLYFSRKELRAWMLNGDKK